MSLLEGVLSILVALDIDILAPSLRPIFIVLKGIFDKASMFHPNK
jgi:hypothetical protein